MTHTGKVSSMKVAERMDTLSVTAIMSELPGAAPYERSPTFPPIYKC